MDPTNICAVCGKKFYREDTYRLHLNVHFCDFDCPLCHKPHTSQLNLDKHVEFQHSDLITGK